MKKPILANGYYYHIYNRGVEKRNVFIDDFDYLRFIHDLFEFNDVAPAGKFSHGNASSEVKPPMMKRLGRKRELLVKIHCFCLMPNHYHLLVEQARDNGITDFMKKLGTGYTMFFNEKYKRVGSLFQGSFKAALVDDDSHLMHLPLYIHLNPLDLYMTNWREARVVDFEKASKFLESYRWSSHLDYTGRKNFPSIISQDFLSELLNGVNGYKSNLKSFLANPDFDELYDVILEQSEV